MSPSGLRRRQYWLNADDTPRELLCLFSLAVDEAAGKARALDLRVRFDVPHAPLFGWANRAPALSELAAATGGVRAPAGWPRFVADRWDKLRGGVFFWTLERSLAHAPSFGVTTGHDICIVLAATAQTLLTGDDALRAHNVRIVERYLPAARAALTSPVAGPVSRVEPPVVPVPLPANLHPDERGVRLDTRDLLIVYASHIGPAYPSKSENQDAVHAIAYGDGAIFALADGVGTSLGARLAAASLAPKACELVRESLAADGDVETALRTAAVRAQEWMDGLLAGLLSGGDLSALGNELPVESARRLLQNTQSGKNPRLAPALTATLMTGVIARAEGGDVYTATVLRVGDGVVERVGADGEVTPVLEMDPETLKISAAMGPGPASRAAIAGSCIVRAATLGAGDLLVVSSDGLTRGHSGPVWPELRRVSGGHIDGGADAARVMLEHAARFADDAYQRDPQTDLFADNLSLLVIAPKTKGNR